MKTLYTNGEIWCSRGRYTKAVLVENHKIIALGSEALAAQCDEKIDLEGKFLAPGFIDAHSVILAKSKSYMNESGGPIKALASFYSVEPTKIIVLHDELDIPYAAIRTKVAGGDNGHNGLKSLTSSFGTADYFRVRLGIGRPMGQQDPGDFVLKQFSKEEKKSLDEFIDRGADCVEFLIERGLDLTQSKFNS